MDTDVRRLDAPEKATGHAVYAADLNLPGMLIGKILRSTVPHASIKKINCDRALSIPGVAAVITDKDFPDVTIGLMIQDETVMARDKIRYIGEPVAAVAAIDAETAMRALALIELEIDELPAVLDFASSIDTKALLIHEKFEAYPSRMPTNGTGNICLNPKINKGNLKQGFAESDDIFEDTYTMPVVHQAAIEPRAVVADVDVDGRVHVWCSTQASFMIRMGLAQALDLPMSDIRVTGTRVGGAFGGKGIVTIEPIAAMLAMKAKRPVKLEMTREEDFLSANPRHSMEISIKTGVKKDGTLMAREAHINVDTGAFSYFGPMATSGATILVVGPYVIPHVSTEGICAYTNKISCGPCRGPGAPQAHFAAETQLDRIARTLDMDPIDLRIKNALKAGDSTATGQVLSDSGYRETLEQLKTSMQDHFSNLQATSPSKAVGVGVAGCWWGTAGMGSSATIKLNEDGTVILLMGAVETGAGSNTAMALLISEELGIPVGHIKVISGDTDTCPYDIGAVGSRTTLTMGISVMKAIAGVKNQLLSFAGHHLDAPREMLKFGNGMIYMSDNPKSAVPITQAVSHLNIMGGGPVIASGTNSVDFPSFLPETVEYNTAPSSPHYVYGAQAVAVEVDRDTGKVDVLKVIAVHNVGKAIFRAGIEGQIQGGVATGLGYALSEEVIFSEGRPLNDSFLDYRLPTMMDIPEIIPVIVEKENAKIPDDIRGVGEPPTAPTAAAVANAVYDAVGIRVNQLPLTPERVYRALQNKETSRE